MTVPTLDPAEAKTLLDFLLDLLTDDDARAAFAQDPRAALDAAGLGDVTLQEIKDLLPLVLERCDPHRCADYEEECERYEGPCPPAHCPPHLSHCDDRPAHHDVEIDKVVTHLNYVCNNYSFDSHDTIFNNNVSIVNLGDGDVDFDQAIDFHPVTSDNGGTSIGGDNAAPIAHGDGNVFGDGNQVSGAGSTTAFGAGSATSFDHVGTGDGGAISANGPATGNFSPVDDHSHTAVNGHGNNLGAGTITDDHSDNSVDSHDHVTIVDSGNTDSSVHDNPVDNSTELNVGGEEGVLVPDPVP